MSNKLIALIEAAPKHDHDAGVQIIGAAQLKSN
jgi:hypothetical protein